MKKFFLPTLLCATLTTVVLAQVPQGINYQAVARDAGGVLLATQSVGVRLTITNGNSMSVLYQETHSTTTNTYGLFNVTVGQGTPVSGTFAAIPWASSEPWLQVELDPNGGAAYVLMGSQQLMSVPYALYAAQSGSAPVQTNATLGGDGSGGNPLRIAQQGATNGQALKWNGTAWAPANDNSNTYTQGTGINIAGNVVSYTGDVNASDDVTNTTPAGGDLGGSYPNPDVNKLRGVTVSTTTPTNGQVLKYNGTQWAPAADNNNNYIGGAGISIGGGTINNLVTGLNDLSDVTSTGASSGQVLKYNGSTWVPGTDNTAVSSGAVNTTPRISGDGTAGSPIDIAQQGAASGQVLGWNGSAWAPQNSAGSSWGVNGNDIYNSNSGHVGIGTSTPQARLDVDGGNVALNNYNLLLRAGNDYSHGLRYDTLLNGPYLFGYDGGSLGTVGMPNALEWSWTGDVLAKNSLFTQNNLVVDNANANTGSLSNGLTFGSGSGEGIASRRTPGLGEYGLDFYTAGTKRMTITNGGSVGLGIADVTNSTTLLHMHRTTGIPNIQFTTPTTGTTGGDGFEIGLNDVNGTVSLWNNEDQDMILGTNNNEVIRLQSNGQLQYSYGTPNAGEVLTSDGAGNASWAVPAAGQVAFSVGRIYSTLVIDGGGVQPSLFDTVRYNIGNAYDLSTGRFTAPSAGLYFFHYSVGWDDSGGNGVEIFMRKVGGTNLYLTQNLRVSGVAIWEVLQLTHMYQLQAGEQIEFGAGGQGTIFGITGLTKLIGYKVN